MGTIGSRPVELRACEFMSSIGKNQIVLICTMMVLTTLDSATAQIGGYLTARSPFTACGRARSEPPATTQKRHRACAADEDLGRLVAAIDPAERSEVVAKERGRKLPSCDQTGMPPTVGGSLDC